MSSRKGALVTLSDDELESVKALASAAQLSVSNYFRTLIGLPALKAGAPAGNRNALKKQTAKKSRARKDSNK